MKPLQDLMIEFNKFSYDTPSNKRLSYLEDVGDRAPGYTTEQLEARKLVNGQPRYTQVTAENYPNIYTVLQEEADFRNISPPPIYMNNGENEGLGIHASRELHSIFMTKDMMNFCDNKQELRALIAHEVRHLYQNAVFANDDENHIALEFDADIAAAQSAGSDAIISLRHKLQDYLIECYKKDPELGEEFLNQEPPLEDRLWAISTVNTQSLDNVENDLNFN